MACPCRSFSRGPLKVHPSEDELREALDVVDELKLAPVQEELKPFSPRLSGNVGKEGETLKLVLVAHHFALLYSCCSSQQNDEIKKKAAALFFESIEKKVGKDELLKEFQRQIADRGLAIPYAFESSPDLEDGQEGGDNVIQMIFGERFSSRQKLVQFLIDTSLPKEKRMCVLEVLEMQDDGYLGNHLDKINDDILRIENELSKCLSKLREIQSMKKSLESNTSVDIPFDKLNQKLSELIEHMGRDYSLSLEAVPATNTLSSFAAFSDNLDKLSDFLEFVNSMDEDAIVGFIQDRAKQLGRRIRLSRFPKREHIKYVSVRVDPEAIVVDHITVMAKSSFQVEESGLDCTKTYSLERLQGKDGLVYDALLKFNENGKPLEQLLNDEAAFMKVLSYPLPSGIHLDIDMRTHKVISGPLDAVIHCEPRRITLPSGGTMLRLAMRVVSPHQAIHDFLLELIASSSSQPLVDIALVLADLFHVWIAAYDVLHQQIDKNPCKMKLEISDLADLEFKRLNRLIYCMSPMLLKSDNARMIFNFIEEHWLRTVEFRKGMEISCEQLDAASILFKLIMGQHCIALITENQVKHMELLLSRTSHFCRSVIVDQGTVSYFATRVNEIKQETALSFLFVKFIGNISQAQASRVIQALDEKFSLRIIFVSDLSVMTLLSSIDCSSKLVTSEFVDREARALAPVRTEYFRSKAQPTSTNCLIKTLSQLDTSFNSVKSISSFSSEIARIAKKRSAALSWTDSVRKLLRTFERRQFIFLLTQDEEVVTNELEQLRDSYSYKWEFFDPNHREVTDLVFSKDRGTQYVVVVQHADLLSESDQSLLYEVLAHPDGNRMVIFLTSFLRPYNALHPLVKISTCLRITGNSEGRLLKMLFGSRLDSMKGRNASATDSEHVSAVEKCAQNPPNASFPLRSSAATVEFGLESLVRLCLQVIAQNPDTNERDLSFEEFVEAHPLAQLSTQRSRIALYAKALECLLAASGSNLPSPHFAPIEKGSNTDDSVSPVPYFFRHGVPTAASYVRHESDGLITDDAYIVNQVSLRRSLDWHNLTANRLFPFSSSYFLRLVAAYPERMKLVALLQPTRLFSLLSGVTFSERDCLGYRALCELLLYGSVSENSDLVSPHLAILRWLISTSREVQEDVIPTLKLTAEEKSKLSFTSSDIATLADLQISLRHFNPRQPGLLELVIRLDAPLNLLSQQPTLKNHLTNSLHPDELLLSAWSSSKAAGSIGASAISFLLDTKFSAEAQLPKHPFVYFCRNVLFSEGRDFSQRPALSVLLSSSTDRDHTPLHERFTSCEDLLSRLVEADIFKLPLPSKPDEIRDALLMRSPIVVNFRRLTAAAFGYLFERAFTEEQVFVLAVLLELVLSALSDEQGVRKLFLVDTLTSLKSKSLQRFYLSNLLLNEQIKFFSKAPFNVLRTTLSFVNNFDGFEDSLRLVFTAIREKSIKGYESLLMQVPVEQVDALRHSVVETYKDSAVNFPACGTEKFLSLCLEIRGKFTSSGSASLLTNLNHPPYQESTMGLRIAVWLMSPDYELDVMTLNSEARGILYELVGHESLSWFRKAVMDNLLGMCSLAQFFVAPYVLRADVIDHFLLSFKMDKLPRQLYLITEQSLDFPLYFVEITRILLSPQIINDVIAKAKKLLEDESAQDGTLPLPHGFSELELSDETKNDPPKLADYLVSCYYKHITIDVTSGVSDASVTKNALALYLVSLIPQHLFHPTSLFLKHLLFSWFYAAGFSNDNIKSLHPDLERAYESIHPGSSKLDVKKTTLYPFPSLINTYYKASTSNRLFGMSLEDGLYTRSRLETLKVDKPPVPHISELMATLNGADYSPTPKFFKVTKDRFKAVGLALKEDLILAEASGKTNQGRTTFNLRTVKSKLSSLVDFLRELSETKTESRVCTCEDLLVSFVSGVLESFTKTTSSSDSIHRSQAILYRALFSLIGISQSNNTGWLHSLLLKTFRAYDFELCELSVIELSWCVLQGYVKLDKSIVGSILSEYSKVKIRISEEYDSESVLDCAQVADIQFKSPHFECAYRLSKGWVSGSERVSPAQSQKTHHSSAIPVFFTEALSISESERNISSQVDASVVHFEAGAWGDQPITLDVSELFEFVCPAQKNSYVEVRLKPGVFISAVAPDPTNPTRARFQSRDSAEIIMGDVKASSNAPAKVIPPKVLRTFSSHHLAAQSLDQLVDGSILLIQSEKYALMLKRDSHRWVACIQYPSKIATDLSSVVGKADKKLDRTFCRPFWRFVAFEDVYRNLGIESEVFTCLKTLMVGIFHQLFKAGATHTEEQDIIDWFRYVVDPVYNADLDLLGVVETSLPQELPQLDISLSSKVRMVYAFQRLAEQVIFAICRESYHGRSWDLKFIREEISKLSGFERPKGQETFVALVHKAVCRLSSNHMRYRLNKIVTKASLGKVLECEESFLAKSCALVNQFVGKRQDNPKSSLRSHIYNVAKVANYKQGSREWKNDMRALCKLREPDNGFFSLHLMTELSELVFIPPASSSEFEFSGSEDRIFTLGFLLNKHTMSYFEHPSSSAQGSEDVLGCAYRWLFHFLETPLSPEVKAFVLHWFRADPDEIQFPSPPKERDKLILRAFGSYAEGELKHPELVKHLNNLAKFDDPILNTCFTRKGAKYGLRLIDMQSSALYASLNQDQYRKLMTVVDLTQFSSTTLAPAKLLQQITSSFRGDVCVVVVKLTSLDDRLAKWLAEYTRMHPYHFIWFHKVDLRGLLAETLDRIDRDISTKANEVKNIAEESSFRQTEREFLIDDSTELFPLLLTASHAHPCEEISAVPKGSKNAARQSIPPGFMRLSLENVRVLKSRYVITWRDVYLGSINWNSDSDIQFVMVEGEPGLGKTVALDAQAKSFKDKGRNHVVIHIDGSSTDLVKSSITDIAFRKIGSTVEREKNYLIIVDEYHFMSPEQKKQLLSFINQKFNSQLVFILISNRHEESDIKLFQEEIKHFNQEKHIVSCRNSYKDALHFFTAGLSDGSAPFQKAVRFAKYFTRAVRGLFGEGMLSFRFLDLVAKWFREPGSLFESRAATSVGSEITFKLVSLLINKDPMISRDFAVFFVEHFNRLFFQFLEKDEAVAEEELRRFQYQEPSVLKFDVLVNTLIRFTLSDVDETAISFPEFSYDFIHDAHRFHPAYKLGTWVVYLALKNAAYTKDPTAKALETQILERRSLTSLLKLFLHFKMFNSPQRFPTILSEPSMVQLPAMSLRCPTLSREVDFNNLRAVLHNLQRGLFYDEAKAKEFYSMNIIGDLPNLFNVVAAYEPFLLNLSAQNISILLEMEGSSTKLARLILKLRSSFRSQDKSNSFQHVLSLVYWKLYRQLRARPGTSILEELNSDGRPTLICALGGSTSAEESPSSVVRFDLLELLAWVSENVYDLRNTYNVDAKATHDCLVDDLRRCIKLVLSRPCNQDKESSLCDGCKSYLTQLVGYVFSSICFSPSFELPYIVLHALALSQYPPKNQWPMLVQDLSHVLYGHCTAEVLRNIYALCFNVPSSPLWKFINFELTSQERLVIYENIVSSRDFSFEWQEALLRQKIFLSDSLAGYARKFERAVRCMLGEFLSSMMILDKCPVTGSKSKFHQKISELYEAFCQKDQLERHIAETVTILSKESHTILMIDISPSMSEKVLGRNKKKITRFEAVIQSLEDLIQPNVYYYFMFFAEKLYSPPEFSSPFYCPVRSEVQNFVRARQDMIRKVDYGTGTNYRSAFEGISQCARNIMTMQRETKALNVIFLTDGEDFAKPKFLKESHDATLLIKMISSNLTSFYPIMFGEVRFQGSLETIAKLVREEAEKKGQRVNVEVYADEAKNVDDLKKVFAKIISKV